MQNVKSSEVSAKRERTAVRRPSSFVEAEYAREVDAYRSSRRLMPLLLLGDAKVVLDQLPESSIDFAMTSPPYWGKREYEGGGIGLESDYRDFIRHLSEIFFSLKRVLKPEGSFWLNIGDTYQDKGLLGIPWRVAIELTDRQGWILRKTGRWCGNNLSDNGGGASARTHACCPTRPDCGVESRVLTDANTTP